MSPTSEAEIVQFAERWHPRSSGSIEALEGAVRAYRAHRPPPIAPLALRAGGRSISGPLALFDGPPEELDRTAVDLVRPPAPGPRWAFVRPIQQVLFAPGGAAIVRLPGLSSQRAIARLYLTEGAGPSGPSGGSGLLDLAGFRAWVRSSGTIPFSAMLTLYLPAERLRYPLDLLDGLLMPDPRSGAFDPSVRIPTTSRSAWAIDVVAADPSTTAAEARLLEALQESDGLPHETLLKIRGTGISPGQAIRSLERRGLVTFDDGSDRWRIGPAVMGSAGPPGDPAERELKASFQVLVEEADRRATCPLCGDEVPAGRSGLLCPRCEALVGGARRAK